LFEALRAEIRRERMLYPGGKECGRRAFGATGSDFLGWSCVMAQRAMRAGKECGVTVRSDADETRARAFASDGGSASDEQKFGSVTAALVIRDRSADPGFPGGHRDEAASRLLARKGEAAPSALDSPSADGDRDREAALEAEVAARIAEFRDFWQAETDAIVGEAEERGEERLEEARRAWQRERDEVIAKAEENWRSNEAERRANLEADWREKLLNALADVRSAMNAERDKGLLQARAEIDAFRETWQKEHDAALVKAAEDWKAGEEERLAALNLRLREEHAAALAEANARYEMAEAALEELREGGANAQARAEEDVAALRDELAHLRAMFAAQDMELQNARAMVAADAPTPGTKIALRGERMRRGSPGRGRAKPEKPKRRILRDAALTAAVAASVILFYPRGGVPLPASGSAAAEPGGPASLRLSQSGAPAPARAVLLRGANFRAGPSGKAQVLGTLPRGLEVAALEQRGEWTRVRVAAKSADSAPEEGWIYAPFLKSSDSPAK
jgi:hypothetical protein